MRVLIVKMSSMGDLVHVLPALTDASNAIDHIQFDWLAEKAFADIPYWHPNVNNTIIIEWRHWRKNLWQSIKSGALSQFHKQLRQHHYDLIIDAQGLAKSALIAKMAHGPICGLDKTSARESISNVFYQKTVNASWKEHAITRMRKLFAGALDYNLPTTMPDFAIDTRRFVTAPLETQHNYLVFVPNTTWASKHWPDSYWQELVKRATTAGYTVLIPWHSDKEHERAQWLARDSALAVVLPKLSLNEIASLLKNAQGCIAVDTGLSHIAAAIGTPTVSVYGATNADIIGAIGPRSQHINVNFACAPCQQKICSYQQNSEVTPACYATAYPEKVWQAMIQLIEKIEVNKEPADV